MDDSTRHCGELLKKLKLKKNIRVAGINRHNSFEIPNGDSSYQRGDAVIIVTGRDEVIYQLNDIFA